MALPPPAPGSTCLVTGASSGIGMEISRTEALHEDLRGSGVTASALCPGPVKTEFVEVSGAGGEQERLPSFMWTDAAFVAEQGIRGLEKGKRVVVPGKLNRAGAFGGQHVPRGGLLRVAGRLSPFR